MNGSQQGGGGGAPGGLDGMSPDALGQLAQMAGKSKTGSSGTGASSSMPAKQTPPRPVGTISEEIQGLGKDLSKGALDLLSIAKWLGIEPTQMSPEEKAKLVEVHKNFTRLTEEQQMVARQNMQADMQRKRKLEEEAQQKRQRDAAATQEYVMPQGKQSGAQNPGGNKKQRAVQTLQDKRKQMSGPSSAN